MTTATIEKIPVQVNQTLQTIYDRRSVRKFKDLAVGKTLVDQVIDAGRMAPSALNRQPWKFYVVTDKKLLKSLSKQIAGVAVKQITKIGLKEIVKSIWNYLHAPHDFGFMKQSDFIFHEAPVVIFVTAHKDNEWAQLDVGMCCQNMMLAAKSLGLESCPVGLAKFAGDTAAIAELHLQEKEEIQIAILLGYGDETPEVKDRKKNNVIYIS